jgi:hypothetical protein
MGRQISRREFIGTTVGTTAAATMAGGIRPSGATPPNILFILADDLGYGDT